MILYYCGNKGGGNFLMDRQSCEQIMQKYYRELYNYCFAKLNYKKQSAEDCTQELFLIFLKKHPKLDETDNIRIWLYRAADNVIKAHNRKNAHNDISLDEYSEAMNIPAPDSFGQQQTNLSDWLTDEEINIVRLYYETDYGNKELVAKKLGITVTALYQRINKIKNKLKGK